MSKTKKIAVAAVSIVLAATMVTTFAACGERGSGDLSSIGSAHLLTKSQTVLTPSTDDDGDLTYASGTTLSMNMGQNSTYTISYRSGVLATSANVTLPDGNSYTQGDLKPAWQTLADTLDINITDDFTALSSSTQITQAVSDGLLGNYTMISGDATAIVNEGSSNNSFLDLSLYLDYMPHFKKFLEDNPVVYMSLTSNTDSGAIYYAPYFDGNDDIEKYELANQHCVVNLLDDDDAGDTTITFASQAAAKASSSDSSMKYTSVSGTSASVESYMGTTGSWWVETTVSEEDSSSTVKVVVNYDDALAAAKNTSTALGRAVAATGVSASSLESGNIVDIQNLVINGTSGNVTGAQLLAILRAYIDVAYQDESGNSFYDTRSDVFNGYNAAWDVDLLVAFSRCVVTNYTQFSDWGLSYTTTTTTEDEDGEEKTETVTNIFDDGSMVYAIGARQGNSQRENDLVSLAGELYGVRGLTSRYEYTYIDSDGELYDARTGEDMWEALDNMHALVEEGLVYSGTQNASGSTSYYQSGDPVIFMIYDYDQTQTANGGYALQGLTSIDVICEDYNFGPISTPVSKWNDGTTNDSDYSYVTEGEGDDATTYKYMRFTESWRSVKNTGFAVPYANVADDPDILAAALAVIDYMFSNDGQIVMTYGQMSTTGNSGNVDNANKTVTGVTSDGWWYAEEVTEIDEENYWRYADIVDGMYYIKDEWADLYFFYNNKLYTGTYYNGQMAPTMTTASLYFYYGYTINGTSIENNTSYSVALSSGDLSGWGYARSYTNYARGVIGSAMPMGNKLQSFEYQCTAEIGIEGADKVAASLVNGTINHVYLDMSNEKDNLWYTIVPTTLPYDSNVANYISTQYALLTDTIFSGESSSTHNLATDVIFYGLDGTTQLSFSGDVITMPSSAAAMVSLLNNSYDMDGYEEYMQAAWEDIQEFYYEWIELTRLYSDD